MPYEYVRETPSQTAGPFVHIGTMPKTAGFEQYTPEFGDTPAGPDCPGERITVTGRILDGTGAPCRDMMIEVWHADPSGIYPHPEDPRVGEVAADFTGFARLATDFDTGEFRLETVKPGPVPGRHGRPQAPHLNVWIVARGINIGLHTRIYFGDEDNSADPLLGMIEQAHRKDTLIAGAKGDGGYAIDIRLQGDRETVFLDV